MSEADRVWVFPFDAKTDVLFADGTHRYWSTMCRSGRHSECRQTCKCHGSPCACAECDHGVKEPDRASGPRDPERPTEMQLRVRALTEGVDACASAAFSLVEAIAGLRAALVELHKAHCRRRGCEALSTSGGAK